MAKLDRRKKKKRNHPKSIIRVQSPIVVTTKKNKNFWYTLKAFSSKTYFIIGVIITLITGFLLKDQIEERFMSPQELWERKNFIKGIRVPFNVKDTSNYVNILIGTNTYSYSFKVLRSKDYINFSTVTPNVPILIKLVGNQIYVSAIFKDINTGDIIGDMDFNKWRLKNDALGDFKDTDALMEIIDRSGNVAFKMEYVSTINTIKIDGYFIAGERIWVLNKFGIIQTLLKHKTDALRYIQLIDK
jgi:hypothetical protein